MVKVWIQITSLEPHSQIRWGDVYFSHFSRFSLFNAWLNSKIDPSIPSTLKLNSKYLLHQGYFSETILEIVKKTLFSHSRAQLRAIWDTQRNWNNNDINTWNVRAKGENFFKIQSNLELLIFERTHNILAQRFYCLFFQTVKMVDYICSYGCLWIDTLTFCQKSINHHSSNAYVPRIPNT